MIDRWHAAGILFQHWLLKEDRHSIHSPYLFRLYEEVFYPKDSNGTLPEAESVRLQFKSDHRPVPASSYGSRPTTPDNKRTVASVLQAEVAPVKAATLLGRLAAFQNAKKILEIGTSLGLTSLYLSANPDTEVVTLEGNPFIADVARGIFAANGRRNIRLVEGNADETLPTVLKEGFSPDMVVLDANHRYEPTVRYLRQILGYAKKGLTLVVDDIHYSPEMTKAWHTAVDLFPESLSIHLGRQGVIITADTKDRRKVFW